MTALAEGQVGVAEGPEWTAWGEPRFGERGVETAFHHPLILVRARGGAPERVVAPGDVIAEGAGLEWSPMPWALRGRRQWRCPNVPGPGAVFRGSGERLFHATDSVCEQLFEGDVLRQRSRDGWTEALDRRNDYFDAHGIVYRMLVVPESHAIHNDAIPGAPKLSPRRPLLDILAHADARTRERLVYPLDALIAGSARAGVSLPHDVHLTGFGYFLVYRELMASLPNVDPARLLREEDLHIRKAFIAGDVARSVGLPGRRVDLHEPPWPPHRALVKGTSYRTHQVDVYEAEDVSLPKLVLFRTSNSSHLFSHLLRHFSRIAAMATTHMQYDLIESEKPDVVIVETPERYLAHVEVSPNETDIGGPARDTWEGFEMRTGHELPLPRGPI